MRIPRGKALFHPVALCSSLADFGALGISINFYFQTSRMLDDNTTTALHRGTEESYRLRRRINSTVFMKTFLILCGFSVAASSYAEPFTFPEGYRGTRFGDGGSEVLFSDGGATVRYQQVFTSDLFLVDGIHAGWISSIAVRPDDREAGTGHDLQVSVHFDHFLVQLSTTPKAVDSLSPVFTENIGADHLTVVDGPRELSYPSNTPEPYGYFLKINFDRPFYYDPNKGNLLVDFTKFGAGSLGFDVDGTWDPKDGTSAVAKIGDGATAGITESFGFIMQFEIDRVPEPSTLAMLGVGLCGGLVILRRDFHRAWNNNAFHRHETTSHQGTDSSARSETVGSGRA